MPKRKYIGGGNNGNWKRKLFKAGAKAVIQYAGGKADRAINNWIDSKTKFNREVVDTVTGQQDHAKISVKKRHSRKARKWKKFRRRVIRANADSQIRTLTKTAVQGVAVSASDLAATRQGSLLWGGVGRQKIINITLCGYSATNQQINDDLNEMMAILYNDQNQASNQSVNTPVYVKSALWEIMMSNFGTNPEYVDVFHYVCRKSAVYDAEDFVAASDAQIAAGGTPTAGTNYIATPGVEDYGWTPYQSRNFMKHVKIYRKERFLIPAGNTIQVEKRMAINKTWRKEQSQSTAASVQNKMHKGITYGLLFIVYGCPANSINQNITGSCSLNVSVNKSIFFARGNADATIGQDTEWRTFS